jgi:hypothetical protein
VQGEQATLSPIGHGADTHPSQPAAFTLEYPMRLNHIAHAAALFAALVASSAQAAPSLIAIGSLSGSISDLSGLNYNLENGASASLLGGMGSALAWAGGNTFLALPDRGPNAIANYAALDGTTNTVDDTASYIARFQTVQLNLSHTASGSLPYTLTPTLQSTTLLYSTTPLNYGSTANLASAIPALNTTGKYYFTGRSDGFGAGNSGNANNARLDPEGIRVSNDGKSVYVSDEYGPYVYQFDRATGARTNTFALPSIFDIATQSSQKAVEFTNTSGRVTNKGMEGLAITPNGNTLVGFMQSPLLQDGGDGGRYNRIITIDTATGATKQFAYDNQIGTKTYNSSEILALNDTQFLVLERDGKGLGDGSAAAMKQMRLVDIAGATDVSNMSGAASLAGAARTSSMFLDLVSALTGAGLSTAQIPSKLEGATFGQDIVDGGVTYHTLYVANDNDFVNTTVGNVTNDNKFFVFKFTNADLQAVKAGATFQAQNIASVPEPESYALMLAGLGLLGLMRRRAR